MEKLFFRGALKKFDKVLLIERTIHKATKEDEENDY